MIPFSNPWEQGPSMTIHMTFVLQVSAHFFNNAVQAFSAKVYLTQNKVFLFTMVILISYKLIFNRKAKMHAH